MFFATETRLILGFICCFLLFTADFIDGSTTKKSNKKSTTKKPANRKNSDCGGPPDYAPCVPLNTANKNFRYCCQDNKLPAGCTDLCRYDVKVTEVQTAVSGGRCPFTALSPYLYCASQNQDNRKCCEWIKLYKEAGPQCEPFCNPSAGLGALGRQHLTCAAHLEYIMRCHWSGVR